MPFMRKISLAVAERRFIGGGVGESIIRDDGDEEVATSGEVVWDIFRFFTGGVGGYAE